MMRHLARLALTSSLFRVPHAQDDGAFLDPALRSFAGLPS
jgi:hypothetical protein